MLSEKGELSASLHGGVSGVDAQLAYGVSNHLGLILNTSFTPFSTKTHQHVFFEAGGGYFTPLGNIGRFEIYTGMGGGTLNAEFNNQLFESHKNVFNSRGFVQPSIGIATDVVELTASSRFVTVVLMQNNKSAWAPFFEPAATLKLGYRQIKGVAQLGFSFPLTTDGPFYNQIVIFSIGLQLKLGKESY